MARWTAIKRQVANQMHIQDEPCYYDYDLNLLCTREKPRACFNLLLQEVIPSQHVFALALQCCVLGAELQKQFQRGLTRLGTECTSIYACETNWLWQPGDTGGKWYWWLRSEYHIDSYIYLEKEEKLNKICWNPVKNM